MTSTLPTLDVNAMGSLEEWVIETNSLGDPGARIFAGISEGSPERSGVTNVFRTIGNQSFMIWT